MNNYITLYPEALEEAQRLKKVTGRNVEVTSVDCPCDYSKLCYRCGGEGRWFQLVYASCNHVVQEDEGECADLDCAELERLGRLMDETARLDPFVHAPVKSLREVESELMELESVS
jgi:hypothetical protein